MTEDREVSHRHDIRIIKLRCSHGDGSRVFILEVPGNCTGLEVKQRLCKLPQFISSDISRAVLVFQGTLLCDDISVAHAISSRSQTEVFATVVVLSFPRSLSQSPARFGCASDAKTVSPTSHSNGMATSSSRLHFECDANSSQEFVQSPHVDIIEQAIARFCSMGFSREQVEACMRAAHNDAELAVEHLLSGGPPCAELSNTPSAVVESSALRIESVEQFVAKLCDMGATAAQAEDVIRIFREKLDREMGPVEQKALAQLHEMQLPPLEHERALMGLLDVFTRERAGYLLAALNERWDALQSKLSQKQSSEATQSAATLNFTSMEQVVSKMREMGILAEKAQSHIEHMRGRFTRPEQELSFWNQANAWEVIADFHHSESDSPAAGYKSTHASRIASSSAVIQAPALGSASQGMRSGSRVVIDGLVSNPEMNGRAGVICGDFDAQSGQFTVQLDSDGSIPCDRGNFVPSNLRLYKHNPSTEWLDENGCVCQKNVDFSRECAKGHALVPFRTDGVQNGNHMLMCRVCHVAAGSELGDWRVCSVAGCCGGYAVCGSCFLAPHAATPVPTPTASDEFCMQGIGIPYLKWLRSALQPSVTRITTSQFCQMFVRPRTFRSRCSVVDELTACPATSHHVGTATWFISHVWSSCFVDTLDAVLLFFEGRDDAAMAKVWFDIFVQSQHAGLPGQASKPPSCIAQIGSLLLVVDVWNNPTALKRAWCVLELHAIAARKEEACGTFAVAMTREEQMRFITGMSGDVEGAYLDMLGRVDSETGECSRPSDQRSIHAAIRDTVGFAKLNRMLFDVMEGWVEGQLQERVDVHMAGGNVLEAMDCNRSLASFLKQQGKYDAAIVLEKQILEVYQLYLNSDDAAIGFAMSNLSMTYNRLGRHQEAVGLQEIALPFLRLVLDENDPDLGNAMKMLASTYSAIGRTKEALALKEQTLEFELRVLPADHPHIGSAMQNLANAYLFEGRLEDALSLHQKALDFRQRVLPSNHPDIGLSMHLIAQTYSLLGRRQEGLELNQKAVEFVQRVLPPNHPTISRCMVMVPSNK